MRKYLAIQLFLITCTLSGLAQQYVAMLNVDSLKKVLLVAKDTQQINILNKISELYFKQPGYVDTNFAFAERYADKALELSKQIHYKKGTGIALFNTGKVLSHKQDLHHAIAVFNKAIPFLKETNENAVLGSCWQNLADCVHELGNNRQAIQYYDSSIIIFQKIKDSSDLIQCLAWKGHSYFDIGDYINAYKYGQNAFELAQKTGDTLSQILTADHLANIFLGADMPKTVLEYMRIITHSYPNIYDTKEFASWEIWWGLLKTGEAYLQLGDIDSAMLVAQAVGFKPHDIDHDMFLGHLYIAKGEHYKALPYFKNGFQISERSDHLISLARHANGLSRAYLATGNYDAAVYFANKAVQAAQKIHALLEWKNAIGTLTDIYDKTNNYTKAYHFSQLYKSLSDSLAPEEYKRKLALIQIQRDLENQKQEAQLLAKENQLQLSFQQQQLKSETLIKNVLIGSILFVLMLGFFIFRTISLKRKNENLQSERAQAELRQKATELEMQALRAQMNPHFIFNCLSSINRFILVNRTEEASDYLTKFSRLIRMALHNSEKSLITLENEIEVLRLYLDLEQLRFKNSFNYSITFIDTIELSSVFIPPMLMQPFVENAIWHGLQGKHDGNGKIKIDMSLQNNILLCVISDNGIGRSASVIKKEKDITKRSLGINLTQRRLQLIDPLKQNETSIEFQDIENDSEFNTGTCVYLKIPVSYTS